MSDILASNLPTLYTESYITKAVTVNSQIQMIILLRQQMSAWFPRWVWRVIYPNFYEAGARRACVDFLARNALKQHSTHQYVLQYTETQFNTIRNSYCAQEN